MVSIGSKSNSHFKTISTDNAKKSVLVIEGHFLNIDLFITEVIINEKMSQGAILWINMPAITGKEKTSEKAEQRAIVLGRKHALKYEKLIDVQSSLRDYANKQQTLRVSKEPAHPFVKWAGGKTQIVERLAKHFPETFIHYYEPFLGGAAVFFYLINRIEKPFPATISDANHDLINAYKTIRDNLNELVGLLSRRKTEFRDLETKAEKSEYYLNVRSNPPDIDTQPVDRASWFIFLNKTGYNGLYRVNSKGDFNVPYGDYPKAAIFEKDNLERINKILNRKDIQILWQDYQKLLLNSAEKGDFCYLDPPYYSKDNKGFTAYNASLFTAEDQRKLADTYKILTERGVKLLLSNSESGFIRDLFREKGGELKQKGKQYSYDSFDALRIINCKGAKRTGARELLIKNY